MRKVLEWLGFALLVSVMTVALAFGLSALSSHGQEKAVREVNQNTALTTQYLSAIACELALPVDPQTGRDPLLVQACFSNQHLQPPQFLNS